MFKKTMVCALLRTHIAGFFIYVCSLTEIHGVIKMEELLKERMLQTM